MLGLIAGTKLQENYYLLLTGCCSQRRTGLWIHLLFVPVGFEESLHSLYCSGGRSPLCWCAEGKNKSLNFLFQIILILAWFRWQQAKAPQRQYEKKIEGLFHIYCIKSFLTCLYNWLWQLSNMISNKKKIAPGSLRESSPLGSWFWHLAKIMCKGASLRIHGSLQHSQKCDPTG